MKVMIASSTNGLSSDEHYSINTSRGATLHTILESQTFKFTINVTKHSIHRNSDKH